MDTQKRLNSASKNFESARKNEADLEAQIKKQEKNLGIRKRQVYPDGRIMVNLGTISE